MKISRIRAEAIISSIGEKTIEITINRRWKGSAPLGVSRGSREVQEFPENGIPIGHINREVSKRLNGFRFNTFEDLRDIEEMIDINKAGGNSIIAIESALLKAVSAGSVWRFLNSSADEMPMPIGSCIGGGKHFNGESTNIESFLVIPHADNFRDAAFVNHHIYKKIEHDLRPISRSLNGGWVTTLDTVSILDFLKNVAEEVFEKFDIFVSLGLDFAASHLYRGGEYYYRKGRLIRENQIRYVNTLINRYSLDYVADPLEENDVKGFGLIKGNMICGDDLVCSNLNRLQIVGEHINAVVIKPTQIGSLVNVKDTIEWARIHNIAPILAGRAGETGDTIIADLAVAWNLPYIKCGIYGKERYAKINRLREIEKEIK